TDAVYEFSGSANSATVSGLPAGLTATVDVSLKTVTISGSPTAAGTYTISTIGHTAPCTAAQISGSVTVNQPSTLVFSSGQQNQTVCRGKNIVNTYYTFGGSATTVTVSGLPA